MADITMCQGINCPVKDKCYRHKAVPNECRQSWFVQSPGKWENIFCVEGKPFRGEWDCPYYWPL